MRQIKQIIFSDVVGDETIVFTLTELHDRYQVDEALFYEMLEHGLIEPKKQETHNVYLALEDLHRIRIALKLQRDLGVNIPGATLALELFEQLNALHQEIELLHKHLEK